MRYGNLGLGKGRSEGPSGQTGKALCHSKASVRDLLCASAYQVNSLTFDPNGGEKRLATSLSFLQRQLVSELIWASSQHFTQQLH